MAKIAKKLYFDIIGLSAGSDVTIKLTEETITQATATTPGTGILVGRPGTGGDRFGNLLDQLPALNGNSSPSEMARAEITAIWANASSSGGVSGPAVSVNFVQGLNDPTPGNASPFYTAGGTGLTTVNTKAGASAAFITNPRVQIAAVGGSGSVSGTLYIQRQHSIEV